MGLPLCRKCPKCDGHTAADDSVCDDCGYDDCPEPEDDDDQAAAENLMEWPKATLAKEVARLRAIMREHGQEVADAPHSGGDMADVAGDPYAARRGRPGRPQGGADGVAGCLPGYTKQDEKPIMMMVLEGRVNYETRHTKQAYLFGADGAAALATHARGAGRTGWRRVHGRVPGGVRGAHGRDARGATARTSAVEREAGAGVGGHQIPGLELLAARARRDEFHDFVGPHAMPQHVLVDELRKVGGRAAKDIANRVIKLASSTRRRRRVTRGSHHRMGKRRWPRWSVAARCRDRVLGQGDVLDRADRRSPVGAVGSG